MVHAVVFNNKYHYMSVESCRIQQYKEPNDVASWIAKKQTFCSELLDFCPYEPPLCALLVKSESSTAPKPPETIRHKLGESVIIRILFNCPNGSHNTDQSGSESSCKEYASHDQNFIRERSTHLYCRKNCSYADGKPLNCAYQSIISIKIITAGQ